MKKIILLLCLTVANLCYANNDWYTVELIVIKNNNVQNLGSETWPQDPSIPSARKIINLKPANPNGGPSAPFQLLPDSAFTLSHSIAAISKDDAYTILAKLAWHQQIPDEARSQNIHIYGGQAYDSNGNQIPVPSVLPPQDANNPPTSNVVTAQVVPSKWELDGIVNISRRRYLIVRANLLLTEPSATVGANTNQNLVSFRLKQAVSTRSKTLHYLDNPMFGVLVKITPYKNN